VVRAQLLDAELPRAGTAWPDAVRPADVVEVAEQLGAVKIDPTNTLAPAEHTILWSRIGASYEPVQLARATETDRHLFEFDGSFRPVSLLPLMLPAMRRWPQRPQTRAWLEANDRFRVDVLARLRAEGPLFATQIPDTAEVTRPPDGWFGANQTVHMLEFLQRQGAIAVVAREGRRKLWDLAERVYPLNMPHYELDDAERMLAERRLQAAGIAKYKSPWSAVGEAGEPAIIEGLPQKWRVDPRAVAALEIEDSGGRVAFLSPYDGMLFDRPRLREIFEFDYVLEQFKPKMQRKYGYFAHPILLGDRFVGLLEAEVDRKQEALIVIAVHELVQLTPEEYAMVQTEIENLAEWLGVELLPT
jgi:uncharacterized protein YcaQ